LKLFKLGLVLIFAGIALIFITALLPLLLVGFETREVNITSAGCIIVFFIPVCFGVGEHAQQLLLLAVILAIILVALIALLNMWILKTLKKSTSTIYV